MANASAAADSGGAACRAPRLPRWTRQEILVLIESKKLVESRGRAGGGAPVEPKWTSVAAHCRRRGVDRGPMQCRKRWSNLASDFKKIKEWESRGKESFWGMRNDARREKQLPGFFDKEVYDILDGGGKEGEVVVFDSGKTAREEGVFSEEEEEGDDVAKAETEVVEALPISEKEFEPLPPSLVLGAEKEFEPEPPSSSKPESSEQAATNKKQPAVNPEMASPSSQDGAKRRRIVKEGDTDSSMQAQLIQVLEQNNRMLTEHLKAQNTNSQLDREERKEQASNLLGVLNKLADALGRIADKFK